MASPMEPVDLGDLTPQHTEGGSQDSVIVAAVPDFMRSSGRCYQCGGGARYAIAYYTNGTRDGQFYACSLRHAYHEIEDRRPELFPGNDQ